MRWIDYGLGGLTRRYPVARCAGHRRSRRSVPRAVADSGELFGFAATERFYEIGTPTALAETGAFLAGIEEISRRSGCSDPAAAARGSRAGTTRRRSGCPTMMSVAASTARFSSASAPKPWLIQSITMTAPTMTPASTIAAAEQEAVLEPVAGAHPVEPAVALAHEVRRVGVGAHAQRHDLGADDGQQRAADERVDVPLAAEHAEVGDHDELDDRADHRHDRAGEDEQVVGGVDAAGTAGGASRRGSSRAWTRRRAGGTRSANCVRTRCSLAARITISEANSIPVVRRSSLRQHVAAQRAHAAVGVVDAGAEQQVEEARQQRVADVAVMPRHRARMDVLHPVADHHVGAVLQLGDEARDLVEVVGEVGVGHHDVSARARRRTRPCRRCRSRARARGRRSRPAPAASRRAAVLGVVVGDDDLAGDAVARRAPRAPGARTPRCSPPR